MAGAGLAGMYLNQSASGASQQREDATAKGAVLAPQVFSICRSVALHGNLGMDGSKCAVPPHLDRCVQEGGAQGC